MKCFQSQEEQKIGQIRAKSKNGLKVDVGWLCSQPFNLILIFLYHSFKSMSFYMLRTVPIFVTACTFCTSRDTQFPMGDAY